MLSRGTEPLDWDILIEKVYFKLAIVIAKEILKRSLSDEYKHNLLPILLHFIIHVSFLFYWQTR